MRQPRPGRLLLESGMSSSFPRWILLGEVDDLWLERTRSASRSSPSKTTRCKWLAKSAIRELLSASCAGYLDDWARHGEHLRVGIGDADNAGLAELLAAELGERSSVVEVVRYNIGPSVAVHTGPGTVGAVWTAI